MSSELNLLAKIKMNLQDKINEAIKDAKDDGDGYNPESLKELLDFFEKPNLSPPTAIFLLPSGLFSCRWETASKQLALQFSGNGFVTYTFFWNSKNSKFKNFSHGRTMRDEIYTHLQYLINL